MIQRNYQLSAELHDQMLEMMERTIRLCANPVSNESLIDGVEHDATASYPGAYGYSYQCVKCLKDILECGQLIEPLTADAPF